MLSQNRTVVILCASILGIPMASFGQQNSTSAANNRIEAFADKPNNPDPLAGVTKLVTWFSGLSKQIDAIIITEERAQLIRTLDRTRKGLYALEADTRVLLDSIPDKVPNHIQQAQLSALGQDLMTSVVELRSITRQIGADLRLEGANEAEEALSGGLRTRSATLQYLSTAIMQARDEGKWNPVAIRGQLSNGLLAVQNAQLAVTTLSRKLKP